MAKIGEGDKRWIVTDRSDGKNVHNWHWQEKDCMEWTRRRLEDLLEDVTILDGSGGLSISTAKLESVTGEAYVNIRKGKIIPGYEIAVRLNWKGEAKDGDGNIIGKVEGKVELPYIADENAADEPELKVSVMDQGPLGQRFREAFLAKGKPLLLQLVREYVKEMSFGGPAKEELENRTAGQTDSSKSTVNTDKTVPPAEKSTRPAPPIKPKNKEGFKTITLCEKFHCRPSDLYFTLMDEDRWKGFTQSKATISKEVGGAFTIFNGAVNGVNMKLEENKMITQKWRFANWEDGHYSMVNITLEEPEIGITILNLTQTNVPEEDRFGNATVVENTERGWRDLIFHKIRAVFGYGL